MKRGLKQKSCIFLVMALVFFTGRAALAEPPWEWVCNTMVNGCVCETNYQENIAVLQSDNESGCNEQCQGSSTDSLVYVKGVPFERLEITVGDYVEIIAHVCMNLQIKACEVNDITVFPPGARKDRVSADVNGDQGNYGQGRF